MTTYLPEDDEIDVSILSKVFDDKTNSYKFYWFSAILESLRQNNNPRIDMRELSMRMIAKVWYPLDYFKLSFGLQDRFRENAVAIFTQLQINTEKEALTILHSFDSELIIPVRKYIDKTLRYVPKRFIRPFFELELKGIPDGQVDNSIIRLASKNTKVPYFFEGNFIVIREAWLRYFQRHQVILGGFINWHLIRFLQKNNPNVPAISEKLERPADRDFKVAKPFWRTYLAQHPQSTCIYSDKPVTAETLSIDHYLPFSFVAHDQLWNLIPTTKTVNSSKNDWLPATEQYFEKYAQLQYNVFQFHVQTGPVKKLEDYSLLFRESTDTIKASSFEWFRERLSQAILPQLQTARNMGFSYPFIYRQP